MIGPLLDTTRPVFLSDPAARHHPLNRGRVGWWLAAPGLDGGRRWFDLMGLYHATLTGMTTSASGWRGTARPGGSGHVLFDGVDDYADLGAPAAFRALNALTVGAWVRPASASTRGDIVTQWGASGTWHFNLLSSVTAGKFAFYGSTSGFAATGATGATTYAAGAWYRVVGTYDGATLRVYLDGQLDGTAALGGALLSTSTAAVQVGAGGAANFFGGEVDDAGIWDRALSDAEVAADYDLSRRGCPGLLNRYRSRVALLMGAAAPAAPARLLSLLGCGS